MVCGWSQHRALREEEGVVEDNIKYRTSSPLQGKEIIAIKDMKSLRRTMWISAYLRCLILCLMKVQLQTKASIRSVGQHCI